MKCKFRKEIPLFLPQLLHFILYLRFMQIQAQLKSAISLHPKHLFLPQYLSTVTPVTPRYREIRSSGNLSAALGNNYTFTIQIFFLNS
jgi:hypothetical protein